MTKPDVARHWAKQRDTCADQHRYARDHESVDASGCKESLNGDAAVHVHMFEAASFELLFDFRRFPARLFDVPACDRREIQRTAAEYNHWLLAVKCQVSKLQHDLESPAADYDRVDAGEEFCEPVRRLLTWVQEVERVVRPSQKAIYAHSAKD